MQKLRGGFASRAFTFDRKKTRKTDPPCPTLANLPRTLLFSFTFVFFSLRLPSFFIYSRIPLLSIAAMQRVASCSCKLAARAPSCVFLLTLKARIMQLATPCCCCKAVCRTNLFLHHRVYASLSRRYETSRFHVQDKRLDRFERPAENSRQFFSFRVYDFDNSYYDVNSLER